MEISNLENLCTIAIKAAIKAGREIMEVYAGSDFKIEFKTDKSPLTVADLKAHHVIIEELEKTEVQIISEESYTLTYEDRKNWNLFWLVDPLDGTKEFIKKNGEFTVNIALIAEKRPVLGIIFAPALNKIYFGYENSARYADKIDLSQDVDNLLIKIRQNSISLPLPNTENKCVVVGSRSHHSDETAVFIEDLKREKSNLEIVNIGSSLKFCLIAEGTADIYPRFGPTMEWDTAAGHAIVLAAGGRVVLKNDISTLSYNKENQLNPWFIAYNK